MVDKGRDWQFGEEIDEELIDLTIVFFIAYVKT